jgi:excisionase family DNA binding protein
MVELEDLGPLVQVKEQDKAALNEVRAALDSRTPVSFLIGTDGPRLAVPEPLLRIVKLAAAMLARGERIMLAPVHQELSTQEAADQLNVSRPHLIKLLDSGAIPFTKTGRNRRVRFGDVVRYLEQRNRERRDRLRNMIRTSEELGLYDMEEFELESTR